MAARVILDLSGAALDAATQRLAAGGVQATEFGRALDRVPAAAFSIGLGTVPSQARDGTVFASFLLAATRTSRVVVRVDPARQHPINVARTVSTLSALHGGRIGVALHADAATDGWFAHSDGTHRATAADYLRLLSSLWDSWPLDAIAGDRQAPHYVDAQRIVRVADPGYPGIGGPLTLPTDVGAKPPLLLVHEHPRDVPEAAGIDLHLVPDAGGPVSVRAAFTAGGVRLVLGLADLDAVLGWNGNGNGAPMPFDAAGASLRAALGLGPSGRVAGPGEAVFGDATHADRV